MGIFSFRRKNGNETQEERFRRSMDRRLSELLDKKEEELSLLQTISREVRQNSADIRRHDMALEDCLEMLEEQREEEIQGRKRIEELLNLLEVYQEQMWSMRRYAAGHDPAWLPQLELSKETVKGKEKICGISWIEEIGVRVDYGMHEVIEVRETADEGMAQIVAEVCQPGYLYKGEVRKKAKVIAYRLESNKK